MKKTFDALEMKRQGAERVYEIVKDMTPEQELAFWQQQAEELRQLQEDLRAGRVTPGLAIPSAPEPVLASGEGEAG